MAILKLAPFAGVGQGDFNSTTVDIDFALSAWYEISTLPLPETIQRKRRVSSPRMPPSTQSRWGWCSTGMKAA